MEINIMKKLALLAATTAVTFSVAATELKTEDQKISYLMGLQSGSSLKEVSEVIKLDKEAVFAAINDVLDGKKLQVSDEELGKVMQSFMKKSQEYAKKKFEELSAQNIAEAKKLLDENKKKSGVKVTKSGLQYAVLKEGKGKKPTASDVVKVHYVGTFADGTVFDSTYARKEPAVFPLNGIIKGWIEGLQLMPVGSKYEFVIPAELAYGKQGPAPFGPDRALKFEVELLEIKAADTAKAKKTDNKK